MIQSMYVYSVVLLLTVTCCNIKEGIRNSDNNPVKIIFDTDMAGDVDDVGALAALHAMADLGEVEILGVMASATYPFTLLCVDRINTYFNRDFIPVGQLKGSGFNRGSSFYAQNIAEEFSGTLQSAGDAPDAVDQYRKILSQQPDNSVIFLTVGFLTNLRNLIISEPDMNSNLTGKELIKQKVRLWVCMGGHFPKGREANLRVDPEASEEAINNWPTEIIFCGWEPGKMNTGDSILYLPETSPVRRAYESFGRIPHKSWDQVATLYAVRGIDNGPFAHHWKLSGPGQIIVDKNDGSNTWKEDSHGTHRHLIQIGLDKEIAREINALMMYLPK